MCAWNTDIENFLLWQYILKYTSCAQYHAEVSAEMKKNSSLLLLRLIELHLELSISVGGDTNERKWVNVMTFLSQSENVNNFKILLIFLST